MIARNIINLTLISIILLLAGVSLSLLSPFYPSEALQKGVSVTQSGIVMGTAFLATLVFSPFCGKYIHMLGARKFLLVGSAICGTGNLVFGFLNEVNGGNAFFWSSMVVRVVIALGESAMTPAAYALAGQQVQQENQGKAIALAESFFGAGTIFGPSLGGFLYEIGGFRSPFLVAGITLLVMSAVCVFLLEDKTDLYTSLQTEQSVSWKQILLCPGVMISCFGLTFAGSSWSWYQATLEPYLKNSYGLTSSQTGLVFTAFGTAYTICNPLLGYISDKGMDGLLMLIVGNSIIATAFFFLGPVPQLSALAGHLWLTVTSITFQGVGSSFSYLGSLLLMMKSTREAGLPETEQVSSMVSSLWVVSDMLGGYVGSILGSVVYDHLGFEMGTLIESLALGFTAFLIALYYLINNSSCNKKNNKDPEDPNANTVEPSKEDTEVANLISSHKTTKYYGS